MLPKRQLVVETLMIGTMIAQSVRLADELYRLYKVYKPKSKLGFVQSNSKKPWRLR